MCEKSVSRDSTERENWDKIFKSFVKILQAKQDQLESFLKNKKNIENSINARHENWINDIRYLEDQLSLMSNKIETMKMMKLVETTKCKLLTGSKETDCFFCNLKLEKTQEELNDFMAWFDILTLNTNMQEGNGNSKAENGKSLEAEIRKLKLEYEKLVSQKKFEVSDLSRECGFAWNQFKCIESEFTDKLKRKDDEIAEANTKISSLVSYQEELQSFNHEKDETISRLKAKLAEMETNSSKKDEEISKLSQDLESLKKSRSFTTVLTRCTTTRDKGSNGNTVGSQISTKKEKSAASSTPDGKECNGSKRIRVSKTPPVSVSEIPKLFSSTFRVPKLKTPSSGAI